jgi:methionyl-tRNA formyltransferase
MVGMRSKASRARPVEPRNNAVAGKTAGKCRLFFVTEEDPLYVILFFETFLAEYPREEFEICGISIDRAFHEPLWKTLQRMWGFYGVWGCFRLGVRFVKARLRKRSIRVLADAAGVPIVPTRSVNRQEYIQQLRGAAPDVIVSVAAPEIFKSELLGVPRLGCINVHSGRLPTYRGMMPTFWQMLRGERVITITAHLMAEKLDAGDVLGTQVFAIKPRDSLDRIIRGTKCEGARLMIRVLRDLRTGQTPRAPLNMAQADYFSFPRRDDVRQFRKLGHRLL